MFSRLDLVVYLDNHCIHDASCENHNPCVFLGINIGDSWSMSVDLKTC